MEALEQPVPTIHVNSSKNFQDIATYVQKSIRKSRAISRVPKPQRLEIEKALTEKAQGMFLWVDLMLTELSGKTRASSMLESLHKAPKGLDEMLQHVLETFSARLNEEEAANLNIILALVACADTPVRLIELDQVLKIESQAGDGMLGLEVTLRTQYASLFVLNRDDGLTTADLAGRKGTFTQPQAGDSDGDSDSSCKQEFDSDMYRTTVVFCHASIRDYLRNPDYGKVAWGNDFIPIGVDIIQARVNTLKTFLLSIAGLDSFTSYSMSMVRGYALYEWVDQLRHVCNHLNKIDRREKQEMLILLCRMLKCVDLKMFHTYAAPDPVVDFINHETIDLIISLFSDQECINTVDDSDAQKWIRACVLEPAQLFVPLGREAASKWLIDSWNPESCMRIVWAVVILLNGDDLNDLGTKPSVDTVLTVARWAQFEENARWHHRVGICFGFLEHFDAAIEHLKASLELKPIWGAKKDLAEIYGLQGKLEDSIQLMIECEARGTLILTENNGEKITDTEKVETRDLSEVRKVLGLVYIQLGDYTNAIHWLMSCIDLWVYNDTCRAALMAIRLLIASHCPPHEKIMQTLKNIDREVSSYRDDSFLFRFMNNIKDWSNWDNKQVPLICAVSAKNTNDLQWLESRYKDAITERKVYQDGVNAMCFEESLAHLYDRFLGEEDKAVLIWKSIAALHRVPGSLEYETFCSARNCAVASYAYWLLNTAMKMGGDSQALIVQELESLCDNELKFLSSNDTLSDVQPAIYMGVWHKINGREDKARSYFRPYVRRALSLRDIGIRGVVMSVYRVLGHLFAMIGEDEDAITVIQHVHSPFTLRDGTSALPEERMASPWPLVGENFVWYCHSCLKSWGNFVDCNICRRCNADLCGECLKGIKSEGTESHACDASHEWLNIPPPPGVPGTYQLSRNGQALSIGEYMTSIEKSWM